MCLCMCVHVHARVCSLELELEKAAEGHEYHLKGSEGSLLGVR